MAPSVKSVLTLGHHRQQGIREDVSRRPGRDPGDAAVLI